MIFLPAKVLPLIVAGLVGLGPSRAQVPLTELFPFGAEHGDTLVPGQDDGFAGPIPLQTPFPFFNDTHERLYVNINGAVSFRKGISEYTPICGPLDRQSAMIAPYWTDVDTRAAGSVFYRESTDQVLLRKAEADIGLAFPNTWSLSLKAAFIVTWARVPFYGASGLECSDTPAKGLRNTFQVILTTDGWQSYAIFYYNSLNWTTGKASNGGCQGLGGTAAKAGFDVGDGRTFHQVPGSCTTDVLRLAQASNMGSSGKWIFRLDNGLVDAAACVHSDRLRVSPAFVGSDSRSVVRLTGPCLNHTGPGNLTCQVLDTRPVNATYWVDSSTSAIYFVLPLIRSSGRLEVRLTVSEQVFTGYIYVVEARDNITTEVTENINGEPRLTIRWAPNALGTSSDLVDLVIVQVEGNSTAFTEVLLASGLQNTGSYTGPWAASNGILVSTRILPAATEPRVKRNIFFQGLGWSLRVAGILYKVNPDFRNAVNSQAKKLVGPAICLGARISLNSASDRCNDWHRDDPGVSPEGIEPCPPSFSQADQDGRFSKDNHPHNAYFHPGGANFYRQAVPSPVTGGRQQCVYDSKGNLLTTGLGRGTIDAASNLFWDGHWWKDVRPFCLCCKFSNNCDKYFERRPADDGTRYVPPKYGKAIGDPHITTFDGGSYMFNGAGEFWAVRPVNGGTFRMQARMEPLGLGTASVSTAYVMDDGRVRVQVELIRGSSDPIVLLDGEIVPFPPGRDETLLHGTASIRKEGSMVRVQFAGGYTMELSPAWRSLQLRASASQDLLGTALGLLGKFNGNSEDDFTTGNGTVVPANSSARTIHYDFGMSWEIVEADSLFTYGENKSWVTYHNPNFVPSFALPELIPANVAAICNNSTECLFDWASTGNLEFANQTRAEVESYKAVVRSMGRPTLTSECPPLRIQNGQVNLSGRRMSNVARFSCDSENVLHGNDTLICGAAEGSEKLVWLGTLPTCSPAPVPDNVICDGNANECQEPEFPDGSCTTYVSEGCWVKLYCDGCTQRPRNRLQFEEKINWSYEGTLLENAGIHGENGADGSLVLRNVSLARTGTYACKRDYEYGNSWTRIKCHSSVTRYRIQVVPIEPSVQESMSTVDQEEMLDKMRILQEQVQQLQSTVNRLNSGLVSGSSTTTARPTTTAKRDCIPEGKYCGLGINCCVGTCFMFYCRRMF